MDLHGSRHPESENHIFSSCTQCVCVFYQHNSKTNYSKNSEFGILYLYHMQMLLEVFHKDQTKTPCTGARRRILMH